MQAGVSNQVERVLGLYERKRRGVLSEIDEKPERPHNVIRESSLIVRLTYPYADTWIKWLAEQIFSLKRDLPYKIEKSGKAKTSTRTTKSEVFFLMFYWRLFYKIHMLILIISIQLERKREIVSSLNSFGHFFSFQIWRSECSKVPAYRSRHSGRSHKSESIYWANVWWF